jgi:hypothetical protein
VHALLINPQSSLFPLFMDSLPLDFKRITMIEKHTGDFFELLRMIRIVMRSHGYANQTRICGDNTVGGISFERTYDGATVDYFFGMDAHKLPDDYKRNVEACLTHVNCVLFPRDYDPRTLDLIPNQYAPIRIALWTPASVFDLPGPLPDFKYLQLFLLNHTAQNVEIAQNPSAILEHRWTCVCDVTTCNLPDAILEWDETPAPPPLQDDEYENSDESDASADSDVNDENDSNFSDGSYDENFDQN